MTCAPAVAPSVFTPKRHWSDMFDALAAANQAANSGQRYVVKRGLNFAWDCFKGQHFQFFGLSHKGKREFNYTIDVASNLGPFPHLAALGGSDTAVWRMILRFRGYYFSVSLSTAGVQELDPYVVLHPGIKADGQPDHSFLLVVMAVNVGPVPRVKYGMPGGYVMALEDSSGQAPDPPASVLQYWEGRFGLRFDTWCVI